MVGELLVWFGFGGRGGWGRKEGYRGDWKLGGGWVEVIFG